VVLPLYFTTRWSPFCCVIFFYLFCECLWAKREQSVPTATFFFQFDYISSSVYPPLPPSTSAVFQSPLVDPPSYLFFPVRTACRRPSPISFEKTHVELGCFLIEFLSPPLFFSVLLSLAFPDPKLSHISHRLIFFLLCSPCLAYIRTFPAFPFGIEHRLDQIVGTFIIPSPLPFLSSIRNAGPVRPPSSQYPSPPHTVFFLFSLNFSQPLWF